ncbi:MAG: cell wall-binding repeat-containing protein, partial [Firmicutes bacterium]|nr:cell wall-binding repeat-containing protein [Bacillota bacterium]
KSGASAKQGLIKKEPTAEPTGEADTTDEAEAEDSEEPDATGEDATGEDATGEPEEPLAGEPGTEEDTEEAAPVYPTGKEVKATAAATRKVTKGCNRIFGSNRYETSIKLAQEFKKELGLSQFTSIILASGKNYPDALSGSYLAAQKAAPILLVANGVIDDAAAFIAKNLTQDGTVYILGGTASVPKAIEDSIEASRVIRLAGANRYETNLAILEEAGLDGRDLLVCSGLSYPDALSASATGKPILLTANSLLPEQRVYLNEHNDQIQNVYVVGGTGSVNTLVERQLANYGNVTRIAGDNRYETAKRVARKFYPEAREAILADGTNFPDSLAGGVLAWAKDAPLLLSANNMSFRTAYNYIVEKDILHRITLLGGPAVLPAGVAAMNPNGSRFINQMFYVAGVDLFAKGNSMLAQSEFVNWHGDRYYAGGNYAMKKNEIFKADGEFWEADEYGVISKPEGVRFSSPSVIEVSISQQHLWYYEDGELIFDCNVVTGNPWASDYQLRTPYGHSYINNKMTNGTLTGADYSVKVDYWMSFNYGSYYGFHDASWRSSFGGDIYTYDPSHGCVNLPYWAAQELYYHCYVGTDVYIT